MNHTYHPFFQPLGAIRVRFLHSNSYSDADLGRCICGLVQPTLENPSKPSLAEHCIRSEISCRTLQLCQSEYFQVWRDHLSGLRPFLNVNVALASQFNHVSVLGCIAVASNWGPFCLFAIVS
jgi:hypothetical protein